MTRVKICGLRDPHDARAARDAGADMLGVIFAESPRRASLAQARAIRAALGPRIELFESAAAAFGAAIDRAGRPLLVGVFARQSADEIVRIAAAADLDAIQLSGGEHPQLAARLTRPVIRVHHVAPGDDAEALRARVAERPPTVAALETHSGRGGGSGRTFDWSIAAAVARDRPIMLSGGLSPDNVAAAIETVRPWAVDVSSGVEERAADGGAPRPGVKSPDRIRAFIRAARAAGAPTGGAAAGPAATGEPP